MKKNIFFIGLCFFITLVGPLKAQRYLPGQAGLQLTVGGVDKFRFFKRISDKNQFKLFEYHIYASTSWYTSEKDRWGVGFQFMRRKPQEKEGLPKFYSVDQYVGDLFYWMPFFSNRKKNLFLSFGFGANLGYEHSSEDMKKFKDHIELSEKERIKSTKVDGRFLYGIFIGLETEIFLNNHLVFLLNTKARYLGKSFIKDFQFNYGAGFKYLF